MRRKPSMYKTQKAITHVDTHTKLASVYMNVTHICIYIYIYVQLCIYTYTYTYTYICICICICVYIYIYLIVCICICICSVYVYVYVYVYICRVIGFSTFTCASSTAQGHGGSFKNRKPIGRVGCCDSRMAERIH